MRSRKKNRSFKTFIAISFFLFIVGVGLITWTGISAISYVVTQSEHVLKNLESDKMLEQLNLKDVSIKNFQAVPCFEQLKGFFWNQLFTNPTVTDAASNLRKACFEASSEAVCRGENCLWDKNFTNGPAGEII